MASVSIGTKRAQVDDLGVDALGGELLGRCEGDADVVGVGHQRHVASRRGAPRRDRAATHSSPSGTGPVVA